jgi:hypothetical protein
MSPLGNGFARAFPKEAAMSAIHSSKNRPMPDPLSKAFFAADFERVELAHRTVHLNDLPHDTQQAVREFIDGGNPEAEFEEKIAWTEEDIVLLHWGLLRELRRLADPETPLEEKLDTLAWALTDPALDDKPFSMASCIRVVGTSPLSPTAYFGAASVEDIRDWIQANAPRWLRATLSRYPQWVQELIRSQPDWVSRQLARNPQWINEQVKQREPSPQQDLFSDHSVLLAY